MKHTESDLGDGEDVPLVPDEVPHTLQSGRPDRLAGGGERNPQTHEDLPHPHPVVGALPSTLRLLQQPGEGLQVVDLKSDGQTDITIKFPDAGWRLSTYLLPIIGSRVSPANVYQNLSHVLCYCLLPIQNNLLVEAWNKSSLQSQSTDHVL